MKNINVVFSSNEKFVYGLCIAIYSLLKNNKNHKVSVYVLHSELTERNLEKIQKIQQYFSNSSIIIIKVNESRFKDLPLMEWYSIETYYRYILADILPKEDKILYIDVDTLIINDIADLYEIDLQDYYIAGANPEWKVLNSLYGDHMKNLGISEEDLYINAGVTLMNLKKMRSDKMVDKLFENTIKYRKIIRMVDQDIINMTFKGRIKGIDSKYNFRMPLMIQNPEKLKDAKILHFTEEIKPWDGMRYEARIFFSLWYQYEYEFNELIGSLKRGQYKNRSDKVKDKLQLERDELVHLLEFSNKWASIKDRLKKLIKKGLRKLHLLSRD